VPLAALVDCGRHFLARQGLSRAVSESELVRVAVQSLGLSDVARFEPQHKIIEYRLRQPAPLASLTLGRFADELASASPAPGGGSVAALVGALSVSLSAMVGNLSFGKKGYEDVSVEMEDLAVRAQEFKQFFLAAVDRDTASFNQVMAAIRLPKKTEAQVIYRKEKIEAANKEAALVPLAVLERSVEAAEMAREMTGKGNRNSLSDAGVAGLAAETAGLGAFYNVLINLNQIEDSAFTEEIRQRAIGLKGHLEKTAKEVKQTLHGHLVEPWENR
jgi:glutamate formiminotransferase/formiminotetrahydrofolate cyclodeaminase